MDILIPLLLFAILLIVVIAMNGIIWPLIILVVVIALIMALCYKSHKKAEHLLKEDIKRLPFFKDIAPHDEIYPGVKVDDIYIDGYYPHVWVTGLKYGRSIFSEGSKFRYKDSPWTTEIVSIDVVKQKITVRCHS